MTLRDVLMEYVRARMRRLRESTQRAYRREVDLLLAWAGEAGVEAAADLGRAELAAYSRRLFAAAPSSTTLNDRLRRLRSILGWLRRQELLPSLRGDDLRDVLRGEPVPARAAPDHLRPEELRDLVERMAAAGPGYLEPICLYLLSGMRPSEGRYLVQDRVHLGHSPEIRIPHDNRTKPGRAIHLEVSPALQGLLGERRSQRPYVLSGVRPWTRDQLRRLMEAARRRGAPERLTWVLLRHTTATYLTCAPGLYGAAAPYMSARQLGHSVQVAQRYYLGLVRGIPPEARTLEQAMGIEDLLRQHAPWARRIRETGPPPQDEPGEPGGRRAPPAASKLTRRGRRWRRPFGRRDGSTRRARGRQAA